mgnify:CR=1 FL=1
MKKRTLILLTLFTLALLLTACKGGGEQKHSTGATDRLVLSQARFHDELLAVRAERTFLWENGALVKVQNEIFFETQEDAQAAYETYSREFAKEPQRNLRVEGTSLFYDETDLKDWEGRSYNELKKDFQEEGAWSIVE